MLPPIPGAKMVKRACKHCPCWGSCHPGTADTLEGDCKFRGWLVIFCDVDQAPLWINCHSCKGFPGGSGGKEFACNTGDPYSIPGSGRSRGEGNGCPLPYSCLKNSLDRGAWLATYSPWGGKESDTTERLTLLLSKTFRLPQLWMCATGV